MHSSNRPGVYRGTATVPERWAPGNLAVNAWNQSEVMDRPLEQSSAEIQLDAEERLRKEHQCQLEGARATAYEEGLVAGTLAEGTRLRTVVAAAEAALDNIRENETKWQESVVENIAALAVTIARHVVGREISSNPAGIADLVRRALAEYPIDQAMRVRVNPHDLSLLSLPTADGGEPISIAPNRDVRWMADSRIQAGGCVVEGRERIIDGRVDTALERLYRQLTSTNA
ncbi:MAG: FliH/SctL family protein [Gemmatimonadaceae bacterium]